ncbi:MAG TPA: hypothetical protein DIC59_03080, partial [Candidatus Competibacteraceae bacterium]|nr:hypothetical protein [Candidatus Competibacteraceae bacterium]
LVSCVFRQAEDGRRDLVRSRGLVDVYKRQLYMWAGGHHLHWTALPDWVSSLSATFSILLLMPSWGGMI